MATTARLGIDLIAVDKTRSAFQSVQNQMGGLTRAFSVASRMFAGAAVVKAVSVVAHAVGSAVDQMDALGKSAQKIGIPVEELSKLDYAAELAGVSLGEIEGSLGKLSKSLAAVAGGASNDAGAALKALGVSATDATGQLRPTTDILKAVADRFAGAQDGAQKTAYAMALFGKSGADMVPLLNGGAAAIAAAGEKAERFGNVVGGAAAKAAEEFNDNMTDLSRAAGGVVMLFAQGLTPALADITRMMASAITNSSALEYAGRVLGEMFKGLASVLVTVGAALKADIELMLGFAKGMSLVVRGQFSAAADSIKGGFSDAYETGKAGLEMLSTLWRNAEQQEITIMPKGVLPTFSTGSGGGLGKIKDEADAAAKAFQKLVDAGQGVWEQTRTPLEKYQLELRNLNDLLRAGVIDQDTYGRAVRGLQDGFAQVAEAAESMGVSIGDVMSTIGSTMASGFNSAIDGLIDKTMTLGDAVSGMARDVLRSVTQLFTNQAFQMLFGGGSGGASGAGGGILGGLIGKLFGSSFAGLYAKGGSIPSGKWGIAGEAGVPEVVAGPATVFPLARGSGNGGGSMPAIQIIDQRRNAPAVEQRRGANGSTQFIIRDEIDRSIARGSHDRALAARTGGSPALTER